MTISTISSPILQMIQEFKTFRESFLQQDGASPSALEIRSLFNLNKSQLADIVYEIRHETDPTTPRTINRQTEFQTPLHNLLSPPSVVPPCNDQPLPASIGLIQPMTIPIWPLLPQSYFSPIFPSLVVLFTPRRHRYLKMTQCRCKLR